MGRSGGGGGGGRSSGSFGGGRSSGGFSGGGRSSGSGFSSGSFSHSGGYGYRPYRSHRMYGGPHVHVGGYYHSGSWSSIIAWFIILSIIFIAIIVMNNNTGIPNSTKERVALSGVVNKTDWYSDQLRWITNRSVLISGLEDFYKKTGIQPYVVFVPYSDTYWNGSNIDAVAADNYLQSFYERKFTDEAHFIFAYFSCPNDSKYEMEGEFRYLSGYSADTIMDDEAIRILWGHFEKNYYNTSLSIEEMISNTFSQTAKSIMSKSTNVWDFAKIGAILIAIIVVVVIAYRAMQSKHKREKEKEKFTEEILSKPLEKFGDDTSDLEDKYK